MRDKIISLLTKEKKLFFFLTGDLGFKTFDPLKTKIGKRFVNMGVAEQNMINVATGLCGHNFPVMVYSIVNFLTFRSLEQIRNNIAYDKNNIKLISNGAGFSYSILGFTHHGIEDLALMRILPNIKIIVPTFQKDSKKIIKYLLKKNCPIYLRLDNKFANFNKNISEKVNKDTKVLILSYGSIVDTIYQAITEIKAAKNISVYCPIEIKELKNYLKKNNIKKLKKIFIIEEHLEENGMSEVYDNVIKKIAPHVIVKKLGIKNKNPHLVGSRDYLLKKNYLDKISIKNQLIYNFK